MAKTDEEAPQVSDAPQTLDKKPEATEPSVKAEPAAAETAKDEKVAATEEAAPDSVTDAKKDEKENATVEAAAGTEGAETKPDLAASSVEPKPATGETPSGDNTSTDEAKTTDAVTATSEAADTNATTDVVTAGKEATADAAAEGNKSEKEKTPLRLNGASKKRYKWLLDHGYEPDVAVLFAKDPIKVKELREKVEQVKPEPGALKRARVDGAKISQAGATPSKVAKTTPPTGPIRIAVATKDFPMSLLTNEQSKTVKTAILKQVVQQKDSDLKPRFENCIFVGGYLLVLCSDQPTVKFLQQTVPKLDLWKDASLKVVWEKNLLKFDVYYGHFGDSANDSDREILSFVESQNDDVNTAKWAILGRKPLANKQTIELSFTVDPTSAKTLQKLNFELNYKFAKVTLHKKNKPADANNTRSNVRSMNSNGFPNRNPNGLPNRNIVPRNSSSFVPVWDNNLQRRANYNTQANSSARKFNYNRPNSVRSGSSQYDNGFRNRGNGGNSYGGGNQSSGGRQYSLVDSLYEQLKRTVNVGSASSSSEQYGSRRGTDGGRVNSGYNQNGRNGGGYSSSARSTLDQGNRNFFPSSRLGFF